MTTSTHTSRWHPTGISGGGGMFTPAISPHDPELILLNGDMNGAYRSTSGGRQWEMIHWQQLIGCPFCAPVFHPSDPEVIFAAHSSAATLRISRDRGVTWTPFGAGLPGGLRHLAIGAGDGAYMLAATTTGVFVSTDGGAHWRACTGVAGTVVGLHIDQRDPAARRAVVATAETCYRTEDGTCWQPAGAGLPAAPIRTFTGASRDDRCALYCWVDEVMPDGAIGAIFRWRDDERQWVRTAEMHVREEEVRLARFLLVSNACPQTVYAVRPIYSADDTVNRSDDGGESWRPVAFCDRTDPRFNMPESYINNYFFPRSLWGWATFAAAIDPCNAEHLLFDHYCSLFISEDGGASWWAGEVRGSEDCWINNGLNNTPTWHYYIDPFEHQRHYACYTDLGLFCTDNAGASWRWKRDTGANTYELAFDPAVPGRLWGAFSQVRDIPNRNSVLSRQQAGGIGCVGYSEDFGATWRERNLNTLINDSEWMDWDTDYRKRRDLPLAPIISVILDPRSSRDARTLYASVWEHGVFRSTDGGVTWEPRAAGLGAPGVNMRVCRLRLHADGTLFCLVTGLLRDGKLIRDGVGLYRSADDGARWEAITAGLDVRWLTDYDVDPRDSRILYLGVCDDPGRDLREGGLYTTTDGGGEWQRLARKGSQHFGATIHPQHPDWIYLTLTGNDAADYPLWLSKDAGARWTPFTDYPFSSAHRVHFDPDNAGIIYVTGYGGSVYQGPAEP